MPRMTKVVIRPRVAQDERDQITSNLVEQLKQFYCQTSQDTLFNLAATAEKQAFGNAQTREQYFDNLKSLSSQEMEKAYQVYGEINGGISSLEGSLGGAGMETTGSSPYSPHLIGATCNGDSGEAVGNFFEQDKKTRQKLARQRIIARQRKRTRLASPVQDLYQKAPRLVAKEHLSTEIEKTSAAPENNSSSFGSRPAKRFRTDTESSESDTVEWYNRLFETTDASDGSPFLQELPTSEFATDHDYDDIETCLSSTESRSHVIRDFE